MPHIELVLSKPSDRSQRMSLFFELMTTPIAKKYFDFLLDAERAGAVIGNKHAFWNFPHEFRNREWTAHQINRVIDVINDYAPGTVKHRAQPDMGQELMNELHVYFEKYRGPVLDPHPIYRDGPRTVKKAFEDFNLFIHRYEELLRIGHPGETGKPQPSTMLVLFEPPTEISGDHRRQLADEDYDHFTRQYEFGVWHINYCEVGKPLWDVFVDGDEVVGDDNVRPLRYYHPDAFVRFEDKPRDEYEAEMTRFWSWWDDNAEKLSSLGFKKYDKKNSIGYIPAARLVRDAGAARGLSNDALLDMIGHHQHAETYRTHP